MKLGEKFNVTQKDLEEYNRKVSDGFKQSGYPILKFYPTKIVNINGIYCQDVRYRVGRINIGGTLTAPHEQHEYRIYNNDIRHTIIISYPLKYVLQHKLQPEPSNMKMPQTLQLSSSR